MCADRRLFFTLCQGLRELVGEQKASFRTRRTSGWRHSYPLHSQVISVSFMGCAMVTVMMARYFVERVEYFKDPVTVELFFDHARQAIFRVCVFCTEVGNQ